MTGHSIEFRRIKKHLFDFHAVVVTVFAGEIPHILCDLRCLPPTVQSKDRSGSSGGLQQSHQGTDGGGLSRPVRADKAENLTALDRKADFLNSTVLSIAFGELV